MRISDAVSPVRPLAVPFDKGEVLNIEYRPMSYTPEQLDQMQADAQSTVKKDQGRAVAGMVESMLKMLVSWDLTEDDGATPVPIERDALQKVPLNIFTEITMAVARDQQAGEADAPSGAG